MADQVLNMDLAACRRFGQCMFVEMGCPNETRAGGDSNSVPTGVPT